MGLVQPIRDLGIINGIEQHLKETSGRDHLFFVMALNTGMKITELLPLQVADVKRTHLKLRHKEKRRVKKVIINQAVRSAINEYIAGRPDNLALQESGRKRFV